jgi:hypothetical protein
MLGVHSHGVLQQRCAGRIDERFPRRSSPDHDDPPHHGVVS